VCVCECMCACVCERVCVCECEPAVQPAFSRTSLQTAQFVAGHGGWLVCVARARGRQDADYHRQVFATRSCCSRLYLYMQIGVHIFIYGCMSVCTYISMYIHVSRPLYSRMLCICTYMWICMYYTCAYMCIHVYVHTYIYTYVSAMLLSPAMHWYVYQIVFAFILVF